MCLDLLVRAPLVPKLIAARLSISSLFQDHYEARMFSSQISIQVSSEVISNNQTTNIHLQL